MAFHTVEIDNLDEVVANLSAIAPRLARELKGEIRDVARPTLQKARSYASGLGSVRTGAYASSLSMRDYRTGVKLASSDPGAGVIEFANPGALILTGPRAGRRAGVPHGSMPPRALIKAVIEDEESIVQHVNDAVQRICDEGVPA